MKKESIRQYAIAIFGSLLFAIGMNLFIVPGGLYSGGFMGVGQVIRTVLERYFGICFYHVDIAGIIFYIINIPLFALSFFKIGKRFFIKSMVVISAQSIFLVLIPTNIHIIEGDPLASALLGGAIVGIAVGLQLREGASGGGQDILGVYAMKNNPRFSVGRISILVNSIVFTCCLIMFDLSTVLYSLIFVFVSAYVTDRVHLQNVNVKVTIITRDATGVMPYIQAFDRTATIVSGRGGRDGESYDIVYAVLSKHEANQLDLALRQNGLALFSEYSEVKHITGRYTKHL